MQQQQGWVAMGTMLQLRLLLQLPLRRGGDEAAPSSRTSARDGS
jgi:hypothetical protein